MNVLIYNISADTVASVFGNDIFSAIAAKGIIRVVFLTDLACARHTITCYEGIGCIKILNDFIRGIGC